MPKSDLNEQFQQRLRAYSDRLMVLWLKSFDPTFDADEYKRFRREVERLLFDADTFNQSELKDAGQELLQVMVDVQEVTESEAIQESIYRQLARVFQVIHHQEPVVHALSESLPIYDDEDRALIYLLDDSHVHLMALTAQIEMFSYKVVTFRRVEELCRAVAQLAPAAILADVLVEEGLTPDLWVDGFLAEGIAKADIPPTLFMSARDVAAIRLKCVRAGGIGFIPKPLNMNQLISKLDKLSQKTLQNPYRVLVVDDQFSQAQYHASLLEKADFSVETCNQVEDVLVKATDFRPDVIVLDLYMPGFSGLELAMAVRQKLEHVGTQIIFVSAERNVEKQNAILLAVGEAFIEKPVEEDFFVKLVKSRAVYARELSTVMSRDSLTGLLNHGEIKRQLDVELARATRDQKPLSVAMIDIDHFKDVNDNYGHMVGDQVIKTLSLLLSDSMRRTDVVGRYGGEEFVVLMPNTDANTARQVIEWQLEKFSAIASYGTSQFRCTFTAGVACTESSESAQVMMRDADQLLYKAKAAGRSRVWTIEDTRAI